MAENRSLLSIEDVERGFPKELLRYASVVARIDSFLEDLNSEPATPMEVAFKLNDHRKGKIFHPSSIGSQTGKSLCGKYPMGCARFMYYDYVGEKSEGAIEPRVRRIFDTGSSVHAQLQSYLEEIARRSGGTEEFVKEAFFSPDSNEWADRYDIAGSTDGIYIINEPDQVRFGLEIKTINDAGYQKTSSPHPEHLMQGTVYQRCLDLPIMVFLYYNKNDSSLAEFVHVYDERRWEAIVKKLAFVRDCAFRQADPPDREDGWHCMSCKYKGACKPPKRSRASAGASMFTTSRRKGNG